MNNLKLKHPSWWTVVIAVVFFVCSPIMALWTASHMNNLLIWDEQKQRLFLFSAGAIFQALGLLFWVRQTEGKAVEKSKLNLAHQNILEHGGWAVLLLALSLSEAHIQWQIGREVYFSLALIGSAAIIYSYVLKYQHNVDPLKIPVRQMSICCASLYLFIPAFVVWRYCCGAPSLF
jgi:hypothetical protein